MAVQIRQDDLRGEAIIALLQAHRASMFAPARALYERHGFTYCGPFAGYVEDPFSVFMCLQLKVPAG